MARVLKCSFCGKHAGEVARLIAGPKVHICDACVGVCVKLLDVVPGEFKTTWDAMDDRQLLDALKPTAAVVDGTRGVLQAQVDALRKRGISWATIGGELGVSRQAAWERFT
ncbi:AsnC family protein [Hyphomicrobium sp. CS1GBMeth3]|uniref:AsnC family protein n=1 Tax=Hyphomicrobium sp. CS1GBMeth3 TaxID=1892845 RepID=UPI000930233C|nr:AsnC family protein [Hyphomicrobium sp. CS1GBMeth3]